VFIIPPRYIRVEISHQPLWRQKYIGFLTSSDMSVVTLAPLVVVTKNTLARHDIGQPIFVTMGGGVKGLSDGPDHHVHKGVRGKHHTATYQRDGFHVGEDNNIRLCCRTVLRNFTWGTGFKISAQETARIQDKSALRATLSGLYFLEGLIRIATFLAAGLLWEARTWLDSLMAAPIIVAALYAGSHVHTRLSDARMLRMVNLLLLGSAVAVLVKAGWG
jgi:hypothetical protein